ncbi:Hypothetical protein D9617_15g043290 [Elsinoe fawcettii]|nr:Hypothetical protein D9617_15g043290 [Elsinoe fawcettii]
MSATDLQTLLRFLSKDAKVPLAIAMAKVKELQDNQLGSIEEIAKAKLDRVKAIFLDEKIAKSVHNAAKRINKKRAAGEDTTTSIVKRVKKDPFEVAGSKPAAEVESELDLAVSNLPAEDLEDMVFITNRAPLVLAFAATVVKFTMPRQPPSSRLSLAQAVVSLGSQSKAKAIGLQKTPTAEDEGWSKGQPTVKVMNREISVLKRWGYDWKSAAVAGNESAAADTEEVKPNSNDLDEGELPALWAIDLEQLKHLNGPLTFSSASTAETAGLPVYSPQAAKGYVLRSFETAPKSGEAEDGKPAKKKTTVIAASERAANVACLLRALELLFESWASTLTFDELDKRSWSC